MRIFDEIRSPRQQKYHLSIFLRNNLPCRDCYLIEGIKHIFSKTIYIDSIERCVSSHLFCVNYVNTTRPSTPREIKVYADRVQVGLVVEGKFSAHRKRGKKEGRANVRSVNFPSNIVFASNFSLRKALRDR